MRCMNGSIHVAYFGPDARDAAVKRRIESMQQAGFVVRAYTMRRQADMPHGWDNVDLGFVRHVAFVRRLSAIARAVWLLRRHKTSLRQADVWIGRNLDLLIVAFLAHRLTGSRAPLVYECLDIHRLMTRHDIVGHVMRWIERKLLSACSDLVVSSPGFVREYFAPHYGQNLHATLIENRIPAESLSAARPPVDSPCPMAHGKWTIGWYGVLRCKRSIELLRGVAQQFPDRIRVAIHGFTKPEDLPDFDRQISGLPNLSFHGRYRYPDDLPDIYGPVDLVWAGDFHDAAFNSRWLLPNRLYEGGYFGVVPIAPADSDTGRWIVQHDAGFVLDEPLERTLPELLETLSAEQVQRKRENLLRLPASVFIQPISEIRDYVLGVIAQGATGANEPLPRRGA